jgi:hypothetical protein
MRVRTAVGYRRCLGEYRRGNDTRFDNGNPHVEPLHFLREALAQGLQGKLGRGVSRRRSQSHSARYRRDIDDATLPPLAHPGYDGLDAAERAEEIGFHHFAKSQRGAFLHRAAATNPGVIHQHVEATVIGEDLAERPLDRSIIIHVERGHRDRKLLGGHDFLKLTRTLRISHRRNDSMPTTRKRHGGRQSNSAACSGNQCNGHEYPPNR